MAKRAPPARPAHDQVALEILDVAAHLFAARGYEAVTMHDLATRVGMTAPALYWYFDSKQRLLFEVVRRNLARFGEELRAALAAPEVGAPAAARLAAYVRVHLRFQLEKPDRARVYNAMFLGTRTLLAALTPRQREEVKGLQAESFDALRAILADGVARREFALAEVTIAAFGIIAMGEYTTAWFDPRGRLTAADIAEQYAAMAVRMVTRPTPRRRAAATRSGRAR